MTVALLLSSRIGMFAVLLSLCHYSSSYKQLNSSPRLQRKPHGVSNYLEDSGFFKAEKRLLLGFSTDKWNIGQKKYNDFLAVHKMVKKVNAMPISCVEVPMWEAVAGPHYDELQKLLESFWIPDLASTDNLILHYDLVIVPDPTLAKYMVEAFYEKELKVKKKRSYYDKLVKQPWGVVDAYPPKERQDYEKIKNLSKQKWIRKFPPLAVLGEDTYRRLKNHAQIEYFAYGVEDFALHLPQEITPSRRVLVLRYKNRFDTLVQSLVMKGISVTSAYPVTWTKKEWNSQEERTAKEVDVVYFHDPYAVREWVSRLGTGSAKRTSGPLNKATELAENMFKENKDSQATSSLGKNKDVNKHISIPVACHDLEVAKVAKECGFKDIFYAKKPDTDGLTKTVLQAVECARSQPR